MQIQIKPLTSIKLATLATGAALLLIIAIQNAQAGVEQAPKQDPNIVAVQERVRQIVSHSFPSLKGVPIRIKTFKNGEYFFKSRPGIKRLFGKRKGYRIFFSPEVFNDEIPDAALTGVLAHEISHLADYKSRNIFSIISLLPKISNIQTNALFERGIDMDAISKGYSKELIEYRLWIYERLSEDALEKKQIEYLTPDEILILSNLFDSNPELYRRLRKRPPRSLDELNDRIQGWF